MSNFAGNISGRTWAGGPVGVKPRGTVGAFRPFSQEAADANKERDDAIIQRNNQAQLFTGLRTGAFGPESNPLMPNSRRAEAEFEMRNPSVDQASLPPPRNTISSPNYGGGRPPHGGYTPAPRLRRNGTGEQEGSGTHGYSRARSGDAGISNLGKPGFAGLDAYDDMQERDEYGRRRSPVIPRKHGTPMDDGSDRMWERPGQPLLVNDGSAPEFIKMPWGEMMRIDGPQQVITPQMPVQIIPARANGTPTAQEQEAYNNLFPQTRKKRTADPVTRAPVSRARFHLGTDWYPGKDTDTLEKVFPEWKHQPDYPDDSWESNMNAVRQRFVENPDGSIAYAIPAQATAPTTVAPPASKPASNYRPGVFPAMMARPAPLPPNSDYGLTGLDDMSDWLKSVPRQAQAAPLPRDMALPPTPAPAPSIQPTTALALGAPVDTRAAQLWANNLRAAASGNPALEARAQQATEWAAMTPESRAQIIRREEHQQQTQAAGDNSRFSAAEQARDPGLWAQLEHYNRTGRLPAPVTSEVNGLRHLNIDPRYGSGSSRQLTQAEYQAAPPGVFREAGMLNPDGSPKVDASGRPLRDSTIAEMSPQWGGRQAWLSPAALAAAPAPMPTVAPAPAAIPVTPTNPETTMPVSKPAPTPEVLTVTSPLSKTTSMATPTNLKGTALDKALKDAEARATKPSAEDLKRIISRHDQTGQPLPRASA